MKVCKQLVWSILFVIGIAVACTTISFLPDTTASNVVEAVLDDYLQGMSTVKPFTYDVVSIRNPTRSNLAGDVWCIVFEPSMQMEAYDTPENREVVDVNHFVIVKQGPHWNGLVFQDDEQNHWLEVGCDKW